MHKSRVCSTFSLWDLIVTVSYLPTVRANFTDTSQGASSGAVTLASDIAPLVQLIGAAPLVQFLGHSLGSKRGMLTILGSIGIITAISIYIRVYSFSWMRYAIGRAGERMEVALTEVYRLPKEGDAVFWTGKGGLLMPYEGRSVVIMKLRKRTAAGMKQDGWWDRKRGAAERLRDVEGSAEVTSITKTSLEETDDIEAVDPLDKVFEAWPQISPTTISRSRCVTIGQRKVLVCCTTAMGTATLRSQTARRRVAVLFYLLCLLTVIAQGWLSYLMFIARVQRWLIVSSHVVYYSAFAAVLWRLLSVDKRRSARERLLDKHGYVLESLILLQPGVLSGDSSMPELVSFPPGADIDFVMFPEELDQAMSGSLGVGQQLDKVSNKSHLSELVDSALMSCLVVGYMLYFIALSTMKTLATLLVLATAGPSLVAKGLVNTVESNRVKPLSICLAAGRSDVTAVLLTSVTHGATSADLTSLFIRLVLQLKLQPKEIEPTVHIRTGEWVSFVPVAQGHRRYSDKPLIAFPAIDGFLPLGLLVRLWLISGDVTPQVDLPEKIDSGHRNDDDFSSRSHGHGPDTKCLLNNWVSTAEIVQGECDLDRIMSLRFRIHGNWYRGLIRISLTPPEKYIDLADAQHRHARCVSDTETTLEYAILEIDWMHAVGSRAWDSGSRHSTMTSRMANTLERYYGIRPKVKGAMDGRTTSWTYSGDIRPPSRG